MERSRIVFHKYLKNLLHLLLDCFNLRQILEFSVYFLIAKYRVISCVKFWRFLPSLTLLTIGLCQILEFFCVLFDCYVQISKMRDNNVCFDNILKEIYGFTPSFNPRRATPLPKKYGGGPYINSCFTFVSVN